MTFDWKACPSPVPMDHWLVTVKYAPSDAPIIGKGRWTFPAQALRDKTLIETLIVRSVRLQLNLDDIRTRQVDRNLSNPQRLWQDFKRDISALTKARIKVTHYKINTHTRLLKSDIKALTNDPDADNSNKIRLEEVYLTSKLEQLERKSAQIRRENLSTELATHGERPGGVWTAMSKEKKPRDLIRHLKVPDMEPPQYEHDSRRMANLTKDYHEKLQQNELDTQEHTDFEAKLNLVLNKIPENQLLTEPERSNLNVKIT